MKEHMLPLRLHATTSKWYQNMLSYYLMYVPLPALSGTTVQKQWLMMDPRIQSAAYELSMLSKDG